MRSIHNKVYSEQNVYNLTILYLCKVLRIFGIRIKHVILIFICQRLLRKKIRWTVYLNEQNWAILRTHVKRIFVIIMKIRHENGWLWKRLPLQISLQKHETNAKILPVYTCKVKTLFEFLWAYICKCRSTSFKIFN